MNKTSKTYTSSPVTVLAAAILLATATSGVQAQGASWEFSLGAQGIFVTDEHDSCGSGCDDMAEDVGGIVGYAGVYAPLQNGSGIYGDLTIDAHESTSEDSDNKKDDVMYGAIGLHYVFDAADPNTWGIFGLVAGGDNNARDDPAGPVWGLGAEKRFGDVYLQGGYMEHFGSTGDNTDTLEDMWFARVGGEKKFANGELNGGLAVGAGDFDEDSGGGGSDDEGTWVQLSLTYDAPLGNSGINWYAGYQGDWVSVDECCGSDTEEGFFHSVQLGIKIPFGDNKTPFKTPNFRAPVTNAGALN